MELTDPYRIYGDKIILKIDHSLRVSELCLDIASHSDFDEKGRQLAALCGLLHDIGRFEQWKRYGTYNDEKSVDHGDLGADFLKESKLIDRFSDSDRDIILDAVKYHNRFSLSDLSHEQSLPYVKLVRDADKIDILHLYANGQLTNHVYDSAISAGVYQHLLDRQVISKHEVINKADIIGLRLAFLFDFNYRRSYEIIRQTHSIDQLFRLQQKNAKNDELKQQLHSLESFMEKYLQEMTGAS